MPRVIVLKLGGSVLRGEASLGNGVNEVRRWLARDYTVVAVVSAFMGETDRLFSEARRLRLGPWETAELVATGEAAAAAALAKALGQGGTEAFVLRDRETGIRTTRDPLEGKVLDVSVVRLRPAISEWPVVIVEGFVAHDETGRRTLLARGGSDLTAIALARGLRSRCRLVKDVPGIYDRDPSLPGARLYKSLSWDDAVALACRGRIVQQGAARLAKEWRTRYEVGGLGLDFATIVGGVPSSLVGEVSWLSGRGGP